jgi:lysozyme family protein
VTPALQDRVIARVLGQEGGLSDHPSDHGGLTHYGLTRTFLQDITGRIWTDDDIRGLTLEQARGLYLRWLAQRRLDQLPEDEPFAYAVVDYAVHSGARTAIRAVQRAIGGVTVDGIAGPETQGAWHLLDAAGLRRVAGEVVASRIEHIATILGASPSQVVFARGWLRRLAAQVRACL